MKKGDGPSAVYMVLFLKNKKFYAGLQLYNSYLLPGYQAYLYWLLFNLPSWLKRNGSMFAYKHVTGRVQLHRLTDEQID